MRPAVKNETIPLLEGWSIVFFLYLFEFFAYLFLTLSEGVISPTLSIEFLDLFVQVLVYLFVLLWCMVRFGSIDILELLPDRRDAALLLLAILIEFWVFGLFVGIEGLKSDFHKSSQELLPSLYWADVFIIILWVPLVEEMVFRRYFLEIQRQHYSTGIAILITACVATFFHFQGSFLPLLWTFPQQMFLSLLYVRSRLGVAVLVHAFVNALVLFLSS